MVSDRSEQIEKYIRGSLHPHDLEAFEDQLLADPNLLAEVRQAEALSFGLKQANFDRGLPQKHPHAHYAAVIAAGLALGFAMSLWFPRSTSVLGVHGEIRLEGVRGDETPSVPVSPGSTLITVDMGPERTTDVDVSVLDAQLEAWVTVQNVPVTNGWARIVVPEMRAGSYTLVARDSETGMEVVTHAFDVN